MNEKSIPLLGEIPGLKEAIEAEQSVREFSFLDTPELICGILVKQFTPRLYILLHSIKVKRTIDGKEVEYRLLDLKCNDDLYSFLWFIQSKDDIRDADARRKFVEYCITLDPEELAKGIYDYLLEAFQDNQASYGRESTEVPYWHFITNIVDALASNYHWSEKEILDLPFKRIFQYMRCLSKKFDGKAKMGNPSDEVKSKYLAKLEEQILSQNNNS